MCILWHINTFKLVLLVVLMKVRLDALVGEAKGIHNELKYWKSKRVMESFREDYLLGRLKEIGIEVSGRMCFEEKGILFEKITTGLEVDGIDVPDFILDYCFRNFSFTGSGGVSTFDIVPYVMRFTKEVEGLGGQKIMVTSGYNAERGVIRGRCVFKNDSSFRNLYVPVSGYFSGPIGCLGDNGDKDFLLSIPSDIFSPVMGEPGMMVSVSQGKVWKAEHSKTLYIGGTPSDVEIRLGDDAVADKLNRAARLRDYSPL